MPSRYEATVDPEAANSAHGFMAQMVGSNKRVLELGAAGGHMTRALTAQGCTVTAVEYDAEAAIDLKAETSEVIVGDLNDLTLLDDLRPDYDVVLCGDVLEHLLDPQAVLDRVTRLLAPGGRVVVSLPHVGHVDVRLALLQGRWDYNSWGLLDATHIRFFTLKTIQEMVARAGLVIIDLRRVRAPAFETELRVDRASVPTAVLDAALQDPEAETYQFVFTAVKDDGNYQTTRLIESQVEVQSEVDRWRVRAESATAKLTAANNLAAAAEQERHRVQDEIDDIRGKWEGLWSQSEALRHDRDRLQAEHDQMRGEWDGLVSERDHLAQELDALRATKTLRYTNLARSAYTRVRRPGS
ncbi:MAG: methyltransferase protein [Frankiales bacterium]|jgi:2-polyprenyl-3-methyl-5-hydroxy-6-metoxy-1,4-benzoquinol methylase|nr:methyltransferase protein [Frankiales bacterium]